MLFIKPVDAGNFNNLLDFHEVFKELTEGFRVMQIEHDHSFGHPLGGIEMEGTDVDIMFFGDDFCNFPDKSFFIYALDFYPGKKPNRFLIFPFCLDDPFTIF